MTATLASWPLSVPSPSAETALTTSALDDIGYVQGSLFGFDDPAVDHAFRGLTRTTLDDQCWIEHVPAWLTGADLVFAELVARVPWRQRHVVMYNRFLPEPRLTAEWHIGDGRPALDVLDDARRALTRRYDEPFDSLGYNLYRTGDDSVAWHGDKLGAHNGDALVAIVSVGAPRPFLLRPTGGGASSGLLLGQGDLLVMGGLTQQRWEHCVPKIRTSVGPRISATFRRNS